MSEPTADPGDHTTLTAVLAEMAADGWGGNVVVTDDARLRCPACRVEIDPATVQVDVLRRMEGTSDPDDMLAVVALTCEACGERGAAVLHYGPTASPEEAEILSALPSHGDDES